MKAKILTIALAAGAFAFVACKPAAETTREEVSAGAEEVAEGVSEVAEAAAETAAETGVAIEAAVEEATPAPAPAVEEPVAPAE